MRADPRFGKQSGAFWANVRTISEQVGYSVRGQGVVKVPEISQVRDAYETLGLSMTRIESAGGELMPLGQTLLDYFAFRAKVLNNFVEPRLMDAQEAKAEFERLRKLHNPSCPLPMNKQKGDKKVPAYFTGIINMLIEANARDHECDFDPRKLTTITRDGAPVRTLARRLDGAFPEVVNPIAVWEIKEYYYTTSFGSRVAGGVYETILDGMELQELYEHEGIEVEHLLMVDAHDTWWKQGKSYLCRIIDMLHMGLVDEVLFGSEVIERLPGIVQAWAKVQRQRQFPG
jgi:hypothetical protein